MTEFMRYCVRIGLVLGLMGYGCASESTTPGSVADNASLLTNEMDDDDDGEVDESDEAAEEGDEDIDEAESDDDEDGEVDEADEGNDDDGDGHVDESGENHDDDDDGNVDESDEEDGEPPSNSRISSTASARRAGAASGPNQPGSAEGRRTGMICTRRSSPSPSLFVITPSNLASARWTTRRSRGLIGSKVMIFPSETACLPSRFAMLASEASRRLR